MSITDTIICPSCIKEIDMSLLMEGNECPLCCARFLDYILLCNKLRTKIASKQLKKKIKKNRKNK